MRHIAIRADHVGKQYVIGDSSRSYKTLRDAIGNVLRLGPTRTRENRRSTSKFWALKDVTFDVREGDVVGVIGRNGAGKSTLLKLMSRITAPTEGMIEITGRVASLLEVGTGFHGELSGRENVFMNGAVLGMGRAEIARKFDAIVDFAEVGKFIDTPVKHFSSGMYLRLAFAVAAHLEPDILIVDEVLAVGDAAFQRKCLGKMDEVSQAGRTVLFVSHNMVAVERLCNRAIVLDEGRVVCQGSATECVEYYLSSGGNSASVDVAAEARRSGTGDIRIVRYEVLHKRAGVLRAGDPFTIRMHFSCRRKVRRPAFAVSIVTRSGLTLFSVYTSDLGYEIEELAGDGHIDLNIHTPNLLAGAYAVHLGVADELTNEWYDLLTETAKVEIEPADVYGTGRQRAAEYSLVFYDCSWELSTRDGDSAVRPVVSR